MRQGPHQKRGRGRGNRRSNTPNRNQTYDSNGPDVRIRGNASQVYEKYLNLARDATASGDRVLAESYYQHAEHYYRILAAFQEAQGGENRGQPAQGGSREWDQDDDGDTDDRSDGNGSDRGDQPGRGERPRADQDRGGDWNRGDRPGRDRGERDRGERGDRDREDRDRSERDRGERRPVRAEGDGEQRHERPAAPQAQAEAPAPTPAPAPVPAAEPQEDRRTEVEAPVAPRADGNEADGIRRTLRLTPSRPARTATPAAQPADEQASAPETGAAEPATATEAAPEAAEPERKPRRRRASPKAAEAEPASNSDSFVAAPAVDDDGAVAAS